MKKLLGITLLLLVGMIGNAQEVVVSVSTFTGGSVDVKPKEGQVVTITVTPDKDYYIGKGDIEVIAVLDPSLATRGDEEQLPAGVVLTLEGEDPADLTLSRVYTFTVPEGLGAWVRKAVFHEVDKPVTSGNLTESVTWEVTTNTEVKTPQVTLTLAGDGSATVDGETAVPWKDFEEQITNVVIGEGVKELGDGLLSGCTALKAITLEGKKFVPLGKNELTKDVTVDVYGLLYNEYKDDKGWGAAVITSTGSVEMPKVAFGNGNNYDLFVTKEPMLVPSVLDAYSVTAIDGSNVKISRIDDRIIPAGVPVLLFSETVKDDDFRTVTTEEKGTAEAGLLKAAGSGGQDVELGGAYLLYNDVFYLSQAGTIPEGGVYIPVSDGNVEQGQEEKKNDNLRVRAFLTIGDDGTTGINSQFSIPNSQFSDVWYDLSGRRLNTAPTAKGIYIFNGKMMIIR